MERIQQKQLLDIATKLNNEAQKATVLEDKLALMEASYSVARLLYQDLFGVPLTKGAEA